MGSSPQSSFLMMLNKILQLDMHPHTGEVRKSFLVYEKGWIIQYIKSPGRAKVELPDVCKNKDGMTNWNSTFYEIVFFLSLLYSDNKIRVADTL